MIPSDPTAPEASAQRARFRGNVRAGIPQRVGHFLRENEWFWAAVFLLLAFAMFTRQFRIQPPPSLPMGGVISRDIRAPFDLQIVDKVATDQKRAEARAKVLPVYDWDSGMADALAAQVSASFATARANREEFLNFLKATPERQKRQQAEEQFLQRLSDTLGGNLPRFALKQFQADGFSVELEQAVRDMLVQAERRKIYPDGDPIATDDAVVIQDIRRPGLGWTQKHPAASDIMSLDEAQRLPGAMAEQLLGIPGQLRGAVEEYVRSLIRPNLTFNSQATSQRQSAAAAQVAPLVVVVKKGQLILKAGEKADESAIQKIDAFQQASRAVINVPLLAALFFLLLLLLAFTFMYLKTYRKQHRPNLNLFVLVLQITAVFLVVAQAFHVLLLMAAEGGKVRWAEHPEHLMFLIPVAAGAILVTLLVDRHIAVVYTLLYSVLFGILMDFSFAMLLYCMLSCFTAIYAAAKLAQRTAQWKASLLVGVVNAALAAGVVVATAGAAVSGWKLMVVPACLGFLAAFPLSTMLVSSLLPLFESAFAILTEVRLLELSNMNHPILRRLAIDAPGTYNHSLMMANLSEAAANAIGANALFCRVACYYHDIGKMLYPSYFVENQQPGQNPHDKLQPRISALIVAAHVKEGQAIARQYGLPQAIIDVIPEHHGTRHISYFLDKALTMVDPEKESINESDFTYPGPRPQTREAAIVMLSDAVEAGSRVLKDPSHSRLKALISEMVERVVGENQLADCNLTFKDLAQVQDAFYHILLGVFSRRISYPGYTFDKEPDHDAARGPVALPPAKTGHP